MELETSPWLRFCCERVGTGVFSSLNLTSPLSQPLAAPIQRPEPPLRDQACTGGRHEERQGSPPSPSGPHGSAVSALVADTRRVSAQTGVAVPVKVDTKGLVAKIKFEAELAGFLTELNGRYKLRVTELTLEPGGHVGEHNHVGPGIRQVTSGSMTYVLPDKTVVYGPGDFFFESGDINHTVFNKTDAPMVHVLFEILPVDAKGPSLIPVKQH